MANLRVTFTAFAARKNTMEPSDKNVLIDPQFMFPGLSHACDEIEGQEGKFGFTNYAQISICIDLAEVVATLLADRDL